MKNGIQEMKKVDSVVNGFVLFNDGTTGMSANKMATEIGVSKSAFKDMIKSWVDGEPNRPAREIKGLIKNAPDSPVDVIMVNGNATSIIKESVIMAILMKYSEVSDVARDSVMAFGQAGVRVYINGMVGNDQLGLVAENEQLKLDVIEAESMYFALESDNMKLDIENRDLVKSVGGYKANASKWERKFQEGVELNEAALNEAENQARLAKDKAAVMLAIEIKTAAHNAEIVAMIAQVQ